MRTISHFRLGLHVCLLLLMPLKHVYAQSSVGLPPISAATCIDAKTGLTIVRRSSLTAFQRLELAKANRACAEARRAEAVAEAMRTSAVGATSLSAQMAAAAVSQAEVLEADRLYATEKAGADFMGMTFGVGVGFSQTKGRVEDATIASDGTVRVLTRQKQTPRVILEAHYYGWCTGLEDCRAAKSGIGPFFGLAAANDTIEAFALGVMFGRKDTTDTASGGFSVGVGAVLDREVKVLARGFQEGKPPPSGETGVVFEKKSKWSPLLFFTRTF